MNAKSIYSALGTLLLLCGNSEAQHLWWNPEKQNDTTCVYGEITVLATNPGKALKHLTEAEGVQDSQKNSSPFTIMAKNPKEIIETTTNADSVIFNIKSPSGIGGATITVFAQNQKTDYIKIQPKLAGFEAPLNGWFSSAQ
jgi:hypothetical protein